MKVVTIKNIKLRNSKLNLKDGPVKTINDRNVRNKEFA